MEIQRITASGRWKFECLVLSCVRINPFRLRSEQACLTQNDKKGPGKIIVFLISFIGI